ncbi:unnamed protein product [Calicophoron daubneyi]|uniref:HTH La-type RNA-binding domain-containing protein n=1 Tax=Calicophoron daubneyi TaxID=300641 RepID=A0AAV2T2W3_CALDB
MTENVASKFVHLSIHSEKNVTKDEPPSRYSRTNGEDEKSKGNPWKPTSENNALEAEAWPEPSAPGEQRRSSSFRQFDEKPKRKIKWQSYEVDNASCSFSRGRGRYTGGSFTTPYYAGAVHSFRRGSGSYRGRGPIDAVRSRGSNGYFVRHPNRPVNADASGEPREERAAELPLTSTANLDMTHSGASSVNHVGDEPSTKSSDGMPDILVDKSRPVADSPNAANSSGALSGHISQPSTDSNPQLSRNVTASVQHAVAPRRSVRERNPVNVQGSQGQGTGLSASMYEAGPFGRARRSYLRQHQPAYSAEPESLNPHNPLNQGLITSAAVQPLLPFSSIPPFAYFISGTAGVDGTILGPNLQLASPSAPQAAIQGSLQLLPNPDLHHPPATTPQIGAETTTSSSTSLSESQQVSSAVTSAVTFSPATRLASASSVQADVVDVHQMIELLNEFGWDKVVLPVSLRENPTVSALIRARKKHDNGSHVSNTDDLNTLPANEKSEHADRPVSKPEDVVNVNDRVYFVPRNLSLTKFLKFMSKLDYIRHHVEYYFSESNLQRDMHLISILEANQKVCPLKDLLQFNRLRWVSTTQTELLEAVSASRMLAVTYDSGGSPVGIVRVQESSSSNRSGDLAPSQQLSGAVLPPDITDSIDQNHSANALPVKPGLSPPVLAVNDVVAVSSASLASTVPSTANSIFSVITTISNAAHSLAQTTVVGTVEAPPLFAVPTQANPQYMPSSAFIINPIPAVDMSSVSGGAGSSAQFPPCFPAQAEVPVSLGAQAIPQSGGFSQPNFYIQQQAAALFAAAANQPAFVSPNSGVQNMPSDSNPPPSFMTTFYRVAAPSHQPGVVGAYIPSMPNPGNFTSPQNPAVLLIPAAQGGAYLTSGPNPLFSRGLTPVSPGSLWIQLPPNSGNAAQGAHSQPYQPFVGFPASHTVVPLPNSFGNGALFPTANPQLSGRGFNTLSNPSVDVDHSGQGDVKGSGFHQSQSSRHSAHGYNGGHHPTFAPGASSSNPSAASGNSSGPNLNGGGHSGLVRIPASHPPSQAYNSETMTPCAVSQSQMSNHSTPKKSS